MRTAFNQRVQTALRAKFACDVRVPTGKRGNSPFPIRIRAIRVPSLVSAMKIPDSYVHDANRSCPVPKVHAL
jgi:hypothetical protein